jgi:hypothetical protein
MSRWFRRHLSPVAAALLVSIAALSVPHEAEPGHESEFAGFVAGDGSDGVLSTEGSGEGHEIHCLACHWARAFRPAVEGRYLAQLPDNGRIARQVGAPRGHLHSPISQPSLRSPPAASLPAVHA